MAAVNPLATTTYRPYLDPAHFRVPLPHLPTWSVWYPTRKTERYMLSPSIWLPYVKKQCAAVSTWYLEGGSRG